MNFAEKYGSIHCPDNLFWNSEKAKLEILLDEELSLSNTITI